jgi:hypothetical protein
MKTLRIPLTILCALFISTLSVHAAQLATAKVIEVTGTVTKYDAAGGQMQLKAGDVLSQGDSISATALSSAELVFSNGSEVTVEENTSLLIAMLQQESFASGQSYEQLQADPSKSQTLLQLNFGELGFHVKKLQPDSSFNIETPLGTAAVRGTQGLVRLFFNAERGEFVLTVRNFDGRVDIISRYSGSFDYGSGNIGDKGFDSSLSNDSSEQIPQQHTVVIRLNKRDTFFDELFDLDLNFVPTDDTEDKPIGLTPETDDDDFPAPEITPDDPGVIVVSPEDQAAAPLI